MKLYLILGGALLWLASIGGATFYGIGIGVDRQQAKDARLLKKADDAVKKAEAAFGAIDQRAAAADVVRETTMREIVREVPTIIDRPVYRNVCVDDDGVRLIKRAVAAANGEPAGGRSDGGAGPVR